MACLPHEFDSFSNSLQDHKADCQQSLHIYKSTVTEAAWNEAGDEATDYPKTDSAKMNLPLATKVTRSNRGSPHFPPAFTRLGDELVYQATKWLKSEDRANKYPYDFDKKGDINADRVPSGVSPIIWAHGLPFFPVYKGYYILTGRQHASFAGWILQEKSNKASRTYPTWTIGPVVAPASAVNLERSIERQMYVHKPEVANDYEKGTEKTISARDIVSKLHTHGSVLLSDNGFIVAPLHRFRGYHIRVGPEKQGLRVPFMNASYFRENKISGDYYEAAKKLPYANESDPGVKDGGIISGAAQFVDQDEDHAMEDVEAEGGGEEKDEKPNVEDETMDNEKEKNLDKVENEDMEGHSAAPKIMNGKGKAPAKSTVNISKSETTTATSDPISDDIGYVSAEILDHGDAGTKKDKSHDTTFNVIMSETTEMRILDAQIDEARPLASPLKKTPIHVEYMDIDTSARVDVKTEKAVDTEPIESDLTDSEDVKAVLPSIEFIGIKSTAVDPRAASAEMAEHPHDVKVGDDVAEEKAKELVGKMVEG